MNPSKITGLAAILRRDPREFMERVAAIAEGRLEPLRVRRPRYPALDWSELVQRMSGAVGARFAGALEEPALFEIEARVRKAMDELGKGAPFGVAHNADLRLARCCYGACRAIGARVVVETGIGYGVTTSYLLAALEQNGGGELHSIDLPPLERGSDDFAGALVPRELRARWRPHRGMSRRVLPALLESIGDVDVFLHDSSHTLNNMRFEFDAVWPQLAPGSVLIADDIEGNSAFGELRAHEPAFWGVGVQVDKQALLGVAVK